MGTPLPENPQGVDCPTCTGAGELFGLDGTPEIFKINLLDLERGTLWTSALGRLLDLETSVYQTVDPCIWIATSVDLNWTLTLGAPFALMQVFSVPLGAFAFSAIDLPPCTVEAPNDINIPAGVITFNGSFTATYSKVFT